MDAVCADDEVDPVRNGLLDSADAVTVVHLDPTLRHITHGREQHSLEIGAHQAEQPTTQHSVKLFVIEPRGRTPCAIDVLHGVDTVGHLLQPRQDADPLRSIKPRPEEIHHVTGRVRPC
jgi:hypothetical protein